MTYDNSNKVSLWAGDKRKNANAPDLRGKVNINGVDYDVALWNNQKATSQKSPVMTGKVSLPQNNAGGGGYQPQQAAPAPAAPVGGYQPQQPHPNNGAPNDQIPF